MHLMDMYYCSKNEEYTTHSGANTKSTLLVCDSVTKVVYWKFLEDSKAVNESWSFGDTQKIFNMKVGFMCPYIGENGRFCKLVDGKIVEIT